MFLRNRRFFQIGIIPVGITETPLSPSPIILISHFFDAIRQFATLILQNFIQLSLSELRTASCIDESIVDH